MGYSSFISSACFVCLPETELAPQSRSEYSNLLVNCLLVGAGEKENETD